MRSGVDAGAVDDDDDDDDDDEDDEDADACSLSFTACSHWMVSCRMLA